MWTNSLAIHCDWSILSIHNIKRCSYLLSVCGGYTVLLNLMTQSLSNVFPLATFHGSVAWSRGQPSSPRHGTCRLVSLYLRPAACVGFSSKSFAWVLVAFCFFVMLCFSLSWMIESAWLFGTHICSYSSTEKRCKKNWRTVGAVHVGVVFLRELDSDLSDPDVAAHQCCSSPLWRLVLAPPENCRLVLAFLFLCAEALSCCVELWRRLLLLRYLHTPRSCSLLTSQETSWASVENCELERKGRGCRMLQRSCCCLAAFFLFTCIHPASVWHLCPDCLRRCIFKAMI